MSFCSSCGAPNGGGAFCTGCGKTMEPATNQFQAQNFQPGQFQTPVEKPSNIFSTLGMVFGGIALLFFPIVFGPAGIGLSAVAKSKNEGNANLALGISIGGTILGFILGALFTTNLYY